MQVPQFWKSERLGIERLGNERLDNELLDNELLEETSAYCGAGGGEERAP